MMALAAVTHISRLARAGVTLARYDVALPEALAAQIPAPVRALGRLARRLSPPDHQPTDNSARLAAALCALGPAYIKLGQFLATRPDILGPALAADLRVLQDRLAPFPLDVAVQVVEAELGQKVEAAFAEFSSPIAAASVAQVHRARLAGSDSPVAVKVLRPGVEREFARDLAVFGFAARMMERRWPASRRLEPQKLVDTLAASVRMELDLRMEAAAASEIAERTRPEDALLVPEIRWDMTTRRMLTTGWIDGIRLDDLAALDAAGFDRKELAATLLSLFLKQALRDGLFHADMHPGNLFAVRRADDGRAAIAAVDYGIVGRLDAKMRHFMAETLFGFIIRDYRRIAQAHFDVEFVKPPHTVEEFARALRSIGEPVFGRKASEISMARLLGQLFDVTSIFDMRLQPQLVLLQKTMVVVEGLARALDPELDLWETARPIVEAWMTRELGPEARLAEAAQAAASLVRVAARAPQVLEKMESAANQLAELSDGAGLRLHPDTAREIAEANASRGASARWALWAAAAALAVIALSVAG